MCMVSGDTFQESRVSPHIKESFHFNFAHIVKKNRMKILQSNLYEQHSASSNFTIASVLDEVSNLRRYIQQYQFISPATRFLSLFLSL